MKTRILPALCGLLACTFSASAINIVNNPGFETGDFTGWTVTRAASGSVLDVLSSEGHSGINMAIFGAIGSLNDTITQTLTTTPGSTYTFSFWLRDLYASDDGYLTASWNGASVLDIIPATTSTIKNWTQFSFTETATSAATTIGFAGRAYYYVDLDDVSVTQASASVPDAGSTSTLLACGLVGLAALRRKLSV